MTSRLSAAARISGTLFVLLGFLLTGCGSSDEGGGTGGTGVTSRNVGAITGTGSAITVNGVAYDARSATVIVDSSAGDAAALQVGMVVSVDGEVDESGITGTATRIEYDHELQGPIDSIDTYARRLRVLGQEVAVDPGTPIEGATFEALVASDFVEVSGFRDSSGVLHATYIKKEDGSDTDIEGVITNLNAQTFNINGLTVYHAGATLSGATALADGLYVEVDGHYAGGVLTATEIEVENVDTGSTSGERIKIEGYVTEFVSASQFKVNGRPVTTTVQTRYENGTEADLQVDATLSAQGVVDASGVLVADKIEFK